MTDADMEAFVRGLPKAELHLHIEGTLEPEMVFALARKHDIPLNYPSIEALRAAYDFHDLQSFLDIYYEGAKVLRDEEDFRLMTAAYLERVHGQGVVMRRYFSIHRRIPNAASHLAPSSMAFIARSARPAPGWASLLA